MKLTSEYHQLPFHLRGLLVIRLHYLPLIAWYTGSLFFEVWSSGLGVWTSSDKLTGTGIESVLLTISIFVSLVFGILAGIGFVGACILAVGKTKGIPTPHNFAPGVWLKDLVLEDIKVWLMSFLWALAFIVPGILRLIRYSFVPVIVMLESRYHADQVDALKSSIAFSRGVFLKLLGFFSLILLSMFFELRFSASDASALPFAFSRVLTFFIYVYLAVFLCDLYYEKKKGA